MCIRDREYFKFKKQQFELEDLRVMSLQSIRNLNLFATLVTGYIGIMRCEKDDTIFMLELKECSKRIFDVPKFIFYGLGLSLIHISIMPERQRLPQATSLCRLLWHSPPLVSWSEPVAVPLWQKRCV